MSDNGEDQYDEGSGAAADGGNTASSFPLKLHAMLEDASSMGFDNIISWNADGRSFKVHQPAEFSDKIMKNYFKSQNKYKSFQRQLNLYGFTRVPNGPDRGSYIHKHFVKDLPMLALNMARSNKNMIAAKVSAAKQANTALKQHKRFMSMGADEASFPTSVQSLLHERMGSFGNSFIFRNAGSMMNLEDIMGSGQDLFGDVDANQKQQAEGSHHPLRGSPANLSKTEASIQEEQGDTASSSSSSQQHVYSFPWKLYDMLEEVENKGQTDICSWTEDGTAFAVHRVDAFLEEIMPNYFDQRKFESFRRQLNFYGFQRVSRGANRGTYMHENFQKNQRAKCKLITRLAPNQPKEQMPAAMKAPPPGVQAFEATHAASV